MMFLGRRPARKVAGVAAATILMFTAVPATAAPVGPGAPLRVHPTAAALAGTEAGREDLTATCSQGVTVQLHRPDGVTRRVMLTAAHCVEDLTGATPLESTVRVPTPGGDVPVGTVDETSGIQALDPDASVEDFLTDLQQPDWATVVLDEGVAATAVSQSVDLNGHATGPARVMTGIRDYPDLAPGEVSFDNLGQRICTDGNVSGHSCGVQVMRTRDAVWNIGTFYAPGDSGGNNYDPATGEVIGVTSLSLGPVDRTQLVDVALEDAYGIPDGQVNQHVHIVDSTEPHDTTFRTVAEDEGGPGAVAVIERDAVTEVGAAASAELLALE